LDFASVFSLFETFFHRVCAPILVISVLVFIHELGHFLFAKWCGVGVVKFSVGFGPAIFKFRMKETVYQLSIIPLGGFVRMVGDMPDMITGGQVTDAAVRAETANVEESADDDLSKMLGVSISPELQKCLDDRSTWFIDKTYLQKAAIVFAGPLFNFILAFMLIFFTAWLIGHKEPIDRAIIGEIVKGSPAETGGLQAGDEVLRINKKEISSWVELAGTIGESGGAPVALEVKRGEATLPISVTPKMNEVRFSDGTSKKTHMIGIAASYRTVKTGLGDAVMAAGNWTYQMTKMTYVGLGQMVTGKASTDDLAGPIFILQEAGNQSKKGFDRLVNLTALLSISLAVLNLLPIPVLDGGHLLFFLIESIFGPISIRIKEVAQSVGMLLLLGLMVFSVKNDLVRDTDAFSKENTWEDAEESEEEMKKGENSIEQPAAASN